MASDEGNAGGLQWCNWDLWFKTITWEHFLRHLAVNHYTDVRQLLRSPWHVHCLVICRSLDFQHLEFLTARDKGLWLSGQACLDKVSPSFPNEGSDIIFGVMRLCQSCRCSRISLP